jgi:hypothetical protein
MRHVRLRRLVVTIAMTLLVAGCTERKGVAAVGPLPAAPTAYPTGPGSDGPGVARVSEDIQAITIRVTNGAFDADVYTLHMRPTRMDVSTSGGPYTLAIDGVLQPHPLEANDSTRIGLSPSRAGTFTMRLTGDGTDADTATLNVRAPGQR